MIGCWFECVVTLSCLLINSVGMCLDFIHILLLWLIVAFA